MRWYRDLTGPPAILSGPARLAKSLTQLWMAGHTQKACSGAGGAAQGAGKQGLRILMDAALRQAFPWGWGSELWARPGDDPRGLPGK